MESILHFTAGKRPFIRTIREHQPLQSKRSLLLGIMFLFFMTSSVFALAEEMRPNLNGEKATINFAETTLTSSTPAANATNIEATTNISLMFSENIDASTINSTNIIVRGQQTGTIAGTWSASDAEVTFDPTAILTAGEVIHVEISNSVKSTGGGAVTEKAFSFTVMPSSEKAGSDWTAHMAAEANVWRGIIYGNGRFVAVAQSGTNRVMYSEAGETWTAASAAAANQWKSVTYGNGRFVAVSDASANQVMFSDDGVTWTAAAAAEVNSWKSVTYGKGRFVAVAESGTNRVMYSENGVTWTAAAAAEVNNWN